MEALYCVSSHGNPQAQDAFPGLDFTYPLQLGRHISCEHYYFDFELQVENQVKDGKAASIRFHFSVTIDPAVSSLAGEKGPGHDADFVPREVI